MKASELRQKNEGELAKLLEEKRIKLAELRFDLEGGKTKNLKEYRTTKLDIARIETLKRQGKKN
jgi:ribosomal protein L29